METYLLMSQNDIVWLNNLWKATYKNWLEVNLVKKKKQKQTNKQTNKQTRDARK